MVVAVSLQLVSGLAYSQIKLHIDVNVSNTLLKRRVQLQLLPPAIGQLGIVINLQMQVALSHQMIPLLIALVLFRNPQRLTSLFFKISKLMVNLLFIQLLMTNLLSIQHKALGVLFIATSFI